MLRLILLVTGIISFLHFAFPQNFSLKPKTGDVLGINQIEATTNYQVTKEALTIYCINNGTLPENLNKLYDSELSKSKFLDLDKIYYLQKLQGCDFELVSK